MTREQFFSSLESETSDVPEDCSPALQALWLVQRDQWDAAHDLCNDIPDPTGAWIHAYLHRVEGDLENANYWYSRAGQDMPPAHVSLYSEWQSIISTLLPPN